MAQPNKVRPVKSLLKDDQVTVYLNDDESRVLAKALEIEIKRREDIRLGAGALLREFAMPHLREIVASAAQESSAA